MSGASRIHCAALRSKIVSAEEAAALIPSGVNVGMSGFTGAGYPKVVPAALAKRIMDANLHGRKFKIGVWTGASTAPELDGAFAMVDGVEMRLPYQSDPTCRKRINAGEMEYIDIHLSHVAQFVWGGFLGKLDYAVVEVASILEDGRLIPSSSVGNNKTWLDQADKVILEVNSWQNPAIPRDAIPPISWTWPSPSCPTGWPTRPPGRLGGRMPWYRPMPGGSKPGAGIAAEPGASKRYLAMFRVPAGEFRPRPWRRYFPPFRGVPG